MPELPEVETTRRGIEPHLMGAVVSGVTVRQSRLRWPVPEQLADILAGQRLLEVDRRAKYLLLKFEHGCLIVHLGMSGSLRLVAEETLPEKHDHVDICFDNGRCLRYRDPRRFGAIDWTDVDLASHVLLRSLGPEPLSEEFEAQRLYDLSRGKKQAVKTFIMDNHVVVGVGNIYANESLFQSGIDPRRAAGRISLQRYQKLAETIRQVLARAIDQGGTTLKDFVGGDGKPGYFKQELQVYGRGGEQCKVCEAQLKEVKLGQRATVYCPNCQV